ncbi:MAG: MFS transporter [Gammaproteobacteria bacterium]|nr:MFS transporter [Gammaproteobacteria bacterium]MDH4253050.1 MFS transporter [Gammaproteobacteria bacterium]MDH5308528.1 MFS transporter [Gammaproteobacteria bacterium]
MTGTSDPNPANTGIGVRRYALSLLVVAYTLNFIDRQVLAILLPAIKAEFGVQDWVLGFLAGSAFALFYATLGVPLALLADRWNRRNLIAVALAVWSGMTALSGMATSIVQLAIARIGVGIGEAGFSPSAHSMISDYYPPKQRSSAMGIFSTGISIGIMIAYLAGGWVVQHIGWREAFLIVGLPGILLAVIFRMTVAEPPRGMSENRADSSARPRIGEVARYLLKRRSFGHMAVGSGLAAFGGYAVANFFPSFLVRSHGMDPSLIGVYLGLIIGIGGGIGYAGGGYLADHLGRRSHRAALLGVAVCGMIGWCFNFPVFLGDRLGLALSLFVVPVILTNVYLATTFAQTQGLVGLRMRGVAAAILLFILNIIGLGLGPQVTGILSDLYAGRFGDESMRYALLTVVTVVGPWSAFHYVMASRSIEADLAAAED